MSHLIVENVDRVYTPQGEFAETWHGLETVVSEIQTDGANCPDVFCPIVECGVKPDFDAEVSTVPDELKSEMDLSDWKMILADCRNGLAKSVIPLHVPKKGYKIHQNKALFDCHVGAARLVLGDNGFQIATLGTLGAYSQFIVSIAIKGQESFNVGNMANGAQDTWKKFFNLNSSHNGLIGSNRLLSMVRMVCFNTVQMSIADAEEMGTRATIKHTLNSEALITPEQFAKDLETWIKQSENFQALLAATKGQPMNTDEFKAFASGVFTNEKSDELSSNSFNRIQEMESLFVRGLGNAGASRYDAVNAFTEYFTNGNGVGNPDRVKANKRIATANFGRGNEWKIEATRVACDEEIFASTIKRGQVLYADKLAVVNSGN